MIGWLTVGKLATSVFHCWRGEEHTLPHITTHYYTHITTHYNTHITTHYYTHITTHSYTHYYTHIIINNNNNNNNNELFTIVSHSWGGEGSTHYHTHTHLLLHQGTPLKQIIIFSWEFSDCFLPNPKSFTSPLAKHKKLRQVVNIHNAVRLN